MRTTGEPKRIKMIYKEWIEVPEPFKKFIWSTLSEVSMRNYKKLLEYISR